MCEKLTSTLIALPMSLVHTASRQVESRGRWTDHVRIGRTITEVRR